MQAAFRSFFAFWFGGGWRRRTIPGEADDAHSIYADVVEGVSHDGGVYEVVSKFLQEVFGVGPVVDEIAAGAIQTAEVSVDRRKTEIYASYHPEQTVLAEPLMREIYA